MLPQPRPLSAREDQPLEPPNPPECPLMPLKASELSPPLPLCCAQEFDAEERSLLTFTEFPLTFLL
jgi:hypothetical protein